MDSPKTKRTRFSIAKKVEILDCVKTGTPRVEICRNYSIASSTLHTFLKHESKIREEFETNRDSSRQMIRNSPFHELEQGLVKWIRTVRDRKIALNGPMVQEKALEFATAMGVKDFTASGGWLDRFKKREKLEFKVRKNECFLCKVTTLSCRFALV